MDNRSIVVTSEGAPALKMAITIAWDNAPGGKARHYKVVNIKLATRYHGDGEHRGHSTSYEESPDGKPTLILLWNEEKGSLPLPYPLNLDQAVEFVAGWLQGAEFGDEPDHDGSNGKGFHLFNDYWGHVADHRYGIIGVQPAWAMYGK